MASGAEKHKDWGLETGWRGDRRFPDFGGQLGRGDAWAKGPVENSCHFIAHFSTQGSHEFPSIPVARWGTKKGTA